MKYIDADKLKFLINEIYPDAQDSRTCGEMDALNKVYDLIDSLQQEQQEVDLKKFTEKMDAWKARYNYPDNISIKGTMAFTARMFYMYPEVAREWYDSLRKVTLD